MALDKGIETELLSKQLKTVFATVLIAALTQAVVYQAAGLEYSGTNLSILMIEWLVGSLLLGLNAPNRRMAFCCSAGLAVPPISYSMIGYGLLEMGGFLHALAFGSFGACFHVIIQRFKSRPRSA